MQNSSVGLIILFSFLLFHMCQTEDMELGGGNKGRKYNSADPTKKGNESKKNTYRYLIKHLLFSSQKWATTVSNVDTVTYWTNQKQIVWSAEIFETKLFTLPASCLTNPNCIWKDYNLKYLCLFLHRLTCAHTATDVCTHVPVCTHIENTHARFQFL